MTTGAIASLVVGIVIGFVGQRSRMCFIGGIRDWILVRDTFLLKGLVAFGLVAWIAFPLSEGLGGDPVGGFGRPTFVALVSVIVGGFGVGWFSTRAEGCPMRQHILAAQGSGGSMVYLAGFFAGAILFHTVVAPIVGTVFL